MRCICRCDARSATPDRKQKGKVGAGVSSEALVLDAIRTGLRFHASMCQVFLKEIKAAGGAQAGEHKVGITRHPIPK